MIKNKAPLLSFVIPVYNVEQYLKRCLDSIVNQTFTDWEIIIINDCSPDNSQKIIDHYTDIDTRIQGVKNPENKGLGGSRNVGLKYVKGDYIIFIDSDDFISDDEIIQKVYTVVSENNLDILDTMYRVQEADKEFLLPRKSIDFSDKVYTGLEYLDKIKILPVVTWNKVYKKDFILKNNILFKERRYEDICFTLEAIYKAKRIQNFHEPYYNYIIRPGSIMTSKASKASIEDALKLCYDLEELYLRLDLNPEIEKAFFYSFIGLTKYLSNYNNLLYKREIKGKLKAIYDGYRFKILKSKKILLPQKILLFISPSVFVFFLKILKK